MNPQRRGRGRRWWLLLVLVVLVAWAAPYGFSAMGGFLVREEPPRAADAVVVLSTGIEIYPRWIEAARLYREGYARAVVINGNRKTDVLRKLEAQGLRLTCPWDCNARAVLNFLGVPDDSIVSVVAEDVFDTISEASLLVPVLSARGMKRVLVTTSRFHTRRARRIWRDMGDGVLTEITMVAAQDDPFAADGWWREPRQIRWVLSEYGGWLMYWGRKLAP